MRAGLELGRRWRLPGGHAKFPIFNVDVFFVSNGRRQVSATPGTTAPAAATASAPGSFMALAATASTTTPASSVTGVTSK